MKYLDIVKHSLNWHGLNSFMLYYCEKIVAIKYLRSIHFKLHALLSSVFLINDLKGYRELTSNYSNIFVLSKPAKNKPDIWDSKRKTCNLEDSSMVNITLLTQSRCLTKLKEELEWSNKWFKKGGRKIFFGRSLARHITAYLRLFFPFPLCSSPSIQLLKVIIKSN